MFVLWHRYTSVKGTDYKCSLGAKSRGDNSVSASDGYECNLDARAFLGSKHVWDILNIHKCRKKTTLQ